MGFHKRIVINPPAVGDEFKGFGSNSQRITRIGLLGSSYSPFDPSTGCQVKKKFNQQAFDVILGGVADAFEVSKEVQNQSSCHRRHLVAATLVLGLDCR